jgi:putative ubiquitin-RnfH superfamily antitoxin RatB of RatAB toxin-antitoxin module
VAGGRLRVELVRAWPRRHARLTLTLPDGVTVADALAEAGRADPGWQAPEWVGVAIHGEKVDSAQPLRDGDRLELLRPLLIDPKEARRRRVKPRGG